MRTSLRVFSAAVAALLCAAFLTVIPFGQPASAVVGIHTISVDPVTVAENVAGGDVLITVRINALNFVPTADIEADVVAINGTARGSGQDYNGVPCGAQNCNGATVLQHVVFTGGDFLNNITAKQFTLDNLIVNEGFREPDENLTLGLINVQQASVGSGGVVTITNDDGGPTPTFKVTAPAVGPEGNDAAPGNKRVVTVEILNPENQITTLDYATSDATATSDEAKGLKDYTPKDGTLTWPANNGAAQQIEVQILGDTIPEPNEIFGVNFGRPNNAKLNDANAVATLNNDDAGDVPVLNIEPITDKTEGDSGTTTQTVTVTLTNNAQQTVTVQYATSDATATKSTQDAKGDYEEAKGILTFTQGTTSRTFDVPINGDPIDENDETYGVTLTAATNANIGIGNRVATIRNDDYGQITTGPSANGGPHLRLFGASGSDLGGFFTYSVGPNSPPYNAGIHVARGDIFKADGSVGADGFDEVIVGPGKGITARVLIMSTDGAVKGSFFPFGTQFDGGVYVAAGEIDGDASNGDEIVVGAGPGGGPHVRVVKLKTGGADNVNFIGSFFPYGNFPGGVRVAVADVGGDAKAEIITAPGPGGGPHVKVNRLNAQGGADVVSQWFAYGNFTGGVSVAAAKNRVITGAGPGGNPHVRVFDGNGGDLGGWYAYNEGFTGGVNVGAGNLDGTTEPEIVTGAGPGGGPHVKIFAVNGSQPFGGGFFAYAPNFAGGVETAVAVAG